MKQFIYADNAATTKMSDVAVKAMLPYLQEIYANASSVHLLGQRSAAALFSARQQVAQVLNCAPKEVFFTSGGSEADNQALLSAAAIGRRKGKMHIISTAFEHHAILHTLKKLEKEGFEVELLPVHENGMVSARQVADAVGVEALERGAIADRQGGHRGGLSSRGRRGLRNSAASCLRAGSR